MGLAGLMRAAVLSAAVLLAAGPLLAPSPAGAQQRIVSIGTGGVTGVYYAAGGALCRLMNKERFRTGIRCWVESTGGSAANIAALRASGLDFGLAQSDVQFDAYSGKGPYASSPFADLRTVFSVHAEPFTVLARKEAGIARFEDFRGKRFNVGNPGSGTRASMDRLLAALGWTLADFSPAMELRADEHGPALCEGRIDGFFHAVGIPSANIRDPTAVCGARLIPMTGPAIDRLVHDSAYYTRATIPGGMFAANPEATATYGVIATLVTTAAMPDEIVEALMAATFDNFAEFKRLHPAFAELDPVAMATTGHSAPLHAAAEKYYRRKGWIR